MTPIARTTAAADPAPTTGVTPFLAVLGLYVLLPLPHPAVIVIEATPPLTEDRDWDPHSTWFGWAAECGVWRPLAWAAMYGYLGIRLIQRPIDILVFPTMAGLGLIGVVWCGLHVEIVHLKFIWVFLGLALAARTSIEQQ